MIYATTFQASQAGTVSLDIGVSVDNRATVFVNGSISGTNTNNPTISGGTQIGSTIYNIPPNAEPGSIRAFTILQWVQGTTQVVQGTNTLFVVVEDVANLQGVYGNTGVLVAVPEPSTYLLAAIGLGGLFWRAVRRGKRLRDAGGPAPLDG